VRLDEPRDVVVADVIGDVIAGRAAAAGCRGHGLVLAVNGASATTDRRVRRVSRRRGEGRTSSDHHTINDRRRRFRPAVDSRILHPAATEIQVLLDNSIHSFTSCYCTKTAAILHHENSIAFSS